MSQRIYLYGYKKCSASLKAIQSKLREKGYHAVRRDKDDPRVPKHNDVVLVWGSNHIPHWQPRHYINTPDAVANATDKLKCLTILKENEVAIPEFTTDLEVAKTWIAKSWIVCRKLLRASGGKGIQLAKQDSELCSAPLYVKYRRKDKEYRIHVFKGTIIDMQEKRKRTTDGDADAFNSYIRNHSNGWVFCRGDVDPPDDVLNEAAKAIEALKLDFGAVDVIYNSKTGKTYVLEVNTAPGLTGTTLDNYIKALTL